MGSGVMTFMTHLVPSEDWNSRNMHPPIKKYYLESKHVLMVLLDYQPEQMSVFCNHWFYHLDTED